ncbi:processive diacylglycerol beta-glucosyltransferase [Alicyclobacillus contaminans]|uniref:MGDG synthase family glycosyltransferase n=1 Tax=Alicyclobacillus contaminans TaxID=392016 RepID=UPI00042A1208|nr:glycosyltransferase [Alicyclobacillus contaminans]GMA50398.1 processive diacylglycerol beta-glucosyltransferase [Alicyclobacillus contaminans]
MLKVLLMSAYFGDGHNQVANALCEAFRNCGARVHTINCFQETSPHLAKFNEWSYQHITRYLPALYGASYRWTANLDTDAWLWKVLAWSSRRALLDAVRRYQPNAILQLFPDHAAASLKRPHGHPYLGVVITDYSVHSHWFHNNVDTYFIAHDGLRNRMAPFLSPRADVVETGIPIRGQFAKTGDSFVEGRPYAIICTGGRGVFPDLKPVVDALLRGLPNQDIYVLCGRNADLLQQMKEAAERNPRIRPIPFVNHVAPLFQNASFAIVKAGGVTVSELLACGCPMIFYRPQPGQEADNAEFLARMGAGVVAMRPADVFQVVASPAFAGRIAQMKLRCADLARPDAATAVVNHVVQKVEELRRREAEWRAESMECGGRAVFSKPAL